MADLQLFSYEKQELFEALADVIVCTHITWLQRVRGMWRIYVENVDDKVSLLTEGVTLRGKMIKLLNTNPNRLDGKQTVRIRVKDISLSVDDGVILRSLKLRVKDKLTNCENGDRLCIAKSSSLSDTLPKFMAFGHFTGRVFHPGHILRIKNKLGTKRLTMKMTGDALIVIKLVTKRANAIRI
ncbi:hypothetical protein MAR_032273 [Mya arenaria]|uniref:Uncharacterized protein n=1 Tax=Mya arenaria TaxID=6604 RepID=A0ABY7F938_MYAAR|nr:hypothetical protein MAR_032273 [Mya arenaria]